MNSRRYMSYNDKDDRRSRSINRNSSPNYSANVGYNKEKNDSFAKRSRSPDLNNSRLQRHSYNSAFRSRSRSPNTDAKNRYRKSSERTCYQTKRRSISPRSSFNTKLREESGTRYKQYEKHHESSTYRSRHETNRRLYSSESLSKAERRSSNKSTESNDKSHQEPYKERRHLSSYSFIHGIDNNTSRTDFDKNSNHYYVPNESESNRGPRPESHSPSPIYKDTRHSTDTSYKSPKRYDTLDEKYESRSSYSALSPSLNERRNVNSVSASQGSMTGYNDPKAACSKRDSIQISRPPTRSIKDTSNAKLTKERRSIIRDGTEMHSSSTSLLQRRKERERSISPAFSGGSVSKAANDYNSQIEKFLDEQKILQEEMDSAKNLYSLHPERHPDYYQEWEKFYMIKSSKYGACPPSVLQDEWLHTWKAYFFNSHELRVRQERFVLLNKYRLRYSDLEKYQEQKRKDREIEKPTFHEKPTSDTKSQAKESYESQTTLNTISGNDDAPDTASIAPSNNLKEQYLFSSRVVSLSNNGIGVDNDDKNYVLKMVKDRIEKKVMEEFRNAGKELPDDETMKLIDAEYLRIMPEMYHELIIKRPGNVNENPKTKNDSNARNEDPIVNHSISMRQPNCDNKNNDSDVQPMESINWNELSKAVQMVSKTSSRNDVCRENINCGSQQVGNVVKSLVVPKKEHDIVTIDDEEIADISVIENVRNPDEIICLDELSFNDLVNLCKNITQLDKPTQDSLIEYTKKLEQSNPSKVQELRTCLIKKENT